MTIRLVVADDQALIRSGITMILEAAHDLEIVGEADNGAGAVDAVRRLRPDVVLMDIRMPGMDGIEATRELARSGSPTRVLMLTTFDQDEHVFDALQAGASGFLLKSSPPDRLVDAIRLAVEGETLFSPAVTRRLVEHYTRRPRPSEGAPASLSGLTERELEVLRELANGHSNAEIASALYLSVATVKSHVTRILSKLDLRDRVQAVIAAYETGLVQPGTKQA